MLTGRVMLNHHDTACSTPGCDELLRTPEAYVVATFLKPQFRIAVAPTSGQLQVKVELRASEARKAPRTRH